MGRMRVHRGFHRASLPSDCRRAGGVSPLFLPQQGAYAPRSPAFSGTLLHLAGTLDAVARVWQGLQPALGDDALALLALAERAVVDPLQRLADLLQHLLLVLHQAQGELLLEAVAAEVGDVQRGMGQVAARLAAVGPQRLLRQAVDVSAQT